MIKEWMPCDNFIYWGHPICQVAMPKHFTHAIPLILCDRDFCLRQDESQNLLLGSTSIRAMAWIQAAQPGLTTGGDCILQVPTVYIPICLPYKVGRKKGQNKI
jgi:hypothetical protein